MSDEEGLAFDSSAPVETSPIKRFWKKLNTKQKIIYTTVAVGALWFFLDSGEPEQVAVKPNAETKVTDANAQKVLQLSKEQTERRNTSYELGVDYFEQGKYNEALAQFEMVKSIDPTYKKTMSYLEQTTASLKKISELEAEKRAEEERLKTKKIIEELLVKAREAVKERQVGVAESYFAQITEKDPENIEVQQLKMEIENWQQEENRKKLEIAAKEAARKGMVDALNPGKTFYLKKEWYRAILKLEEFLRRKGTDEDLVKEGSDMLSDAKTQLASDLGPLLGKARSLKEGQDLKSAYEAYLEVLKVEPTNAESLNEIDDIKAQLEGKSKRIYREAIIAESLSLFNDAKEKFQEVQQVSPTDSEYYKKATDKLKDYLE
jgi:tetratricopeptide (TPR) repeat protein